MKMILNLTVAFIFILATTLLSIAHSDESAEPVSYSDLENKLVVYWGGEHLAYQHELYFYANHTVDIISRSQAVNNPKTLHFKYEIEGSNLVHLYKNHKNIGAAIEAPRTLMFVRPPHQGDPVKVKWGQGVFANFKLKSVSTIQAREGTSVVLMNTIFADQIIETDVNANPSSVGKQRYFFKANHTGSHKNGRLTKNFNWKIFQGNKLRLSYDNKNVIILTFLALPELGSHIEYDSYLDILNKHYTGETTIVKFTGKANRRSVTSEEPSLSVTSSSSSSSHSENAQGNPVSSSSIGNETLNGSAIAFARKGVTDKSKAHSIVFAENGVGLYLKSMNAPVSERQEFIWDASANNGTVSMDFTDTSHPVIHFKENYAVGEHFTMTMGGETTEYVILLVKTLKNLPRSK